MSFRPKDLYSWRLFRHMKAMGQYTDQYVPPAWFTAMEKVPPNNPGPLIGMKKGKITFPDDELRKKIEKRSQVARQMAKHGFSPLPWWFTRRPFDDAVVEIKQLQRVHADKSLNEVIDMWDEKMRRHIAVRKREQQLQSEEALRKSRSGSTGSGQVTGGAENYEQVITVADSIKVMGLFHDAQQESKLKKEHRIKESLRKATRAESMLYSADPRYMVYDSTPTYSLLSGKVKQTGLSDRAKAIFKDAITTDENGHPIASPLRAGEDLSKYQEEEGPEFTVEGRYEEEIINAQRLDIERRLNPTVLRKVAQAKQVQKIVNSSMKLRRQITDFKSTYSQTDDMTPFDFLLTYIKAYSINRVSPTAAEWTQEKAIFFSDTSGRESEELMSEVMDQFIMEFNRFTTLDEVQMDVGRVMSNLSADLGFEQDPFARADDGDDDALKREVVEPSDPQWRQAYNPKLASTNPVLLELGITPPDFTSIINSFEKYGWSGYQKMKMHQTKMEELFFLLEVDLFLRVGVIRNHVPLKSVGYDPDETSDDSSLSFMKTDQKGDTIDEDDYLEIALADALASDDARGDEIRTPIAPGALDYTTGDPVEFDAVSEGDVVLQRPSAGMDMQDLDEVDDDDDDEDDDGDDGDEDGEILDLSGYDDEDEILNPRMLDMDEDEYRTYAEETRKLESELPPSLQHAMKQLFKKE